MSLEYEVTAKIPDDVVKDHVAREYDPSDVYSDDNLDNWARDNGYIKESEIDYEAWAEKNGYVKA